MSENEYALNTNTGRLIKKSTSLYKKLKKLKQVKEIEIEPDEQKPKKEIKPKLPPLEPIKEEEPVKQPEFNEKDLQHKMAELTTDMVATNMKKIVKSQKLSDQEMDTLLKKMLYQKLCADEPKKTPKTKKSKKSKFKLVEPSSSESESESE